MLATARSAIRLAPALRVDAHARARPVRVGYSPIRRRALTLPTFARASLGDARGRRPISSPVVSSRPGSASASRRRASRRAAAEGDGAGDRDEDSGQSSVAEAETNAADDADSYNVAEEMPDTIPYKSRDSADEEDDDDDISRVFAEQQGDARTDPRTPSLCSHPTNRMEGKARVRQAHAAGVLPRTSRILKGEGVIH